MTMRIWLTCLLTLIVANAAYSATVEARLIRGTHEAIPPDEYLRDIESKLKKQFGYPHYRQLGSGKSRLEDKTQRLNLGEGFSVVVTPQGAKHLTRELHIELHAGKTVVAQMPVKLAPKGHLFVGPIRVGKDWLVLALRVVE